MNRRRAESFRRSQNRLRALAERALDTLEAQLGQPVHDSRTALAVLERCGLADADMSKIGPISARGYIDLQAADDRMSGRFTPADREALIEAMSWVEVVGDVTDAERERVRQKLIRESEKAAEDTS